MWRLDVVRHPFAHSASELFHHIVSGFPLFSSFSLSFLSASESANGLRLSKCSLPRLDLLSCIYSLKEKAKEKCRLSSSHRRYKDLKEVKSKSSQAAKTIISHAVCNERKKKQNKISLLILVCELLLILDLRGMQRFSLRAENLTNKSNSCVKKKQKKQLRWCRAGCIYFFIFFQHARYYYSLLKWPSKNIHLLQNWKIHKYICCPVINT